MNMNIEIDFDINIECIYNIYIYMYISVCAYWISYNRQYIAYILLDIAYSCKPWIFYGRYPHEFRGEQWDVRENGVSRWPDFWGNDG